MPSEAKINANRANAQKSTGPRTPEGKENSSRNATRHGLTGKFLITPTEDAAGYDTLLDDLMQAYQPANAAESLLVEEIAQSFWRLQRARRIEAEYFNMSGADPVIAFSCQQDRFDNIRRYMTSIERAYHRASEALAAIQKERRKQAQPESGFVSQKPAMTPETPSRRILEFRPDTPKTPAKSLKIRPERAPDVAETLLI